MLNGHSTKGGSHFARERVSIFPEGGFAEGGLAGLVGIRRRQRVCIAACGAGFYFPMGTPGSVEYDEGPSWRAARGRCGISRLLLVSLIIIV